MTPLRSFGLHEAGACPTEIVGLAESGDHLIAKQPLCGPFDDFEEDRRSAATSIKAVVPKYSIGSGDPRSMA